MSDRTENTNIDTQDAVALLDSLVPAEAAERRRAFAALLRALTDERGTYARGDDVQR
jgi:hypothetical protein